MPACQTGTSALHAPAVNFLQHMMTDIKPPSTSTGLARIRDKKAVRRKREIALLALSLCLAVSALIFHEPFLVLVSVFPALASYSQR